MGSVGVIGALCLLLGCELAGEALRRAAHLPVPGPVIGMVLLAVLLLARPQVASVPAGEPDVPGGLERVSETLISHMGLLFVPAGVGVVVQWPLLKAQWLPILAGLVGSTLLGLIVTALVMHWILPKSESALLPGAPR